MTAWRPCVRAEQLPASRRGTGSRLRLRDGTEVVVRRARTADGDKVRHMHDRCSAESLRLRYFTSAKRLPPAVVTRLLNPAAGVTLVVSRPDGHLAAVGSLLHDPTCGRTEVAVLVEDDWQGRGVGTALLGRLAELASAHGRTELHAHVLPGNQRMLDLFDRLSRRVGGRSHRRFHDGVVMVRVSWDAADPRPCRSTRTRLRHAGPLSL